MCSTEHRSNTNTRANFYEGDWLFVQLIFIGLVRENDLLSGEGSNDNLSFERMAYSTFAKFRGQ